MTQPLSSYAPFDALYGQTIVGLKINEDQSLLRFETDVRSYTFYAAGDCCSESWFADICGVDALIGGQVYQVERLDLPEDAPVDGRCRQEADVQYGWKLHTTKGWCDIIFRNSSNGYYCGWLEGPLEAEPEDSRDIGQPQWTAITQDWSA